MAKIKSAWEIAMERTENLDIDPVKLKNDVLIKKGKQLAGKFLNDITYHESELKSELKKMNDEDKNLVLEGIKSIILINIALPNNDLYQDKNARLKELALLIKKNDNTMASEAIAQLDTFYKQYFDNQDDLVEQLKKQFEPQLQQKSSQLSKQYGQEVHLSAEQDPEIMKIIQQQVKKLQDQYTQTLNTFKEQISKSL